MKGDQDDMLGRLRAVLPLRWFPDSAPLLDGCLASFASTASWLHGLVNYARRQARIATADGDWLDMIALDCFGERLVRRRGEGDDAFRARLRRELLRSRATRAALVQQVTDLSGHAPRIFEPSRPADTGGWGIACAYGVAGVGGWGSLMLPYQCFVVAQRPTGLRFPSSASYGSSWGGYGSGAIAYANLGLMAGAATDADIMASIAAVMPACAIAWTRIEG